MPEQIELKLSDWSNTTSDELGYTGAGVSTQIHRYESPIGQSFNVLVADARVDDSDPTILSSTSFNYRIDPLLERRMAILATQSRARVIVSEMPGATIDHKDPYNTRGDWQTPYQSMMAFAGNFGPIATAQLDAIDQTVELEDGQEIQLFGESFGACAVVSMARVLGKKQFHKNFQISRLDLVEPVNVYGNYGLERQLIMARQLARYEAPLRQTYFNENTQIGHGEVGAYEKLSSDTARADRHVKFRQLWATYMTGAGLRKGLHTALKDALADTSNDGTRLHEAEITIARGIASKVSHVKDLLAARDFIRTTGTDVKILSLEPGESDTTPLGHHLLDSFGRLATYALLRKRHFGKARTNSDE